MQTIKLYSRTLNISDSGQVSTRINPPLRLFFGWYIFPLFQVLTGKKVDRRQLKHALEFGLVTEEKGRFIPTAAGLALMQRISKYSVSAQRAIAEYEKRNGVK